ncbi:ejaculatory bulb-specific protein 3-like [Tribolium madens]|uniref:ejaculatory bulb-specific protein 3-like n=1 Tax=Tribolium madens TaxID=41895 RepID=UPI001CF74416|nr:ejaculatory bulb-specific protein 3-like [Tribolium madens]
MKSFVLVAFAAVLGLALARPDEKYTTKYDNIDLEEILKSDRLLKNYFNCLMERGTCSPDGEELKKALPDALHSGCSKCSEKQKEGSKKIIRYLIDNKRDWWNELEAKYDKDGAYRQKYKEEIEKEGIKL